MIHRKKGIILIEVIIIVAVIAILAGIFAPLLFKQSEAKKTRDIQQELENIYYSIFGDLKNNFGYIGNMGRLPDNLPELYIQGTQPGSQDLTSTLTGISCGINVGWQGPYIDTKNSDNNGIIDPFGNYYQIISLKTGSNEQCEDTDSECRWFLLCTGKDGLYNNTDPLDFSLSENNDNIIYPSRPIIVDRVGSNHMLIGNIQTKAVVHRTTFKNPAGNIMLPDYFRFILYYPTNGSPTASSISEFSNPVNFNNFPSGIRAVYCEYIDNESNSLGASSTIKNITIFPSFGPDESISTIMFPSCYEFISINTATLTQPGDTCTPGLGGCNPWSHCQVCCPDGEGSVCPDPVFNPTPSVCFHPLWGLLWRVIDYNNWLCYCQYEYNKPWQCATNCCSGGGGGGDCTLELEINSNLHITDGQFPDFNIYFDCFDENGIKITNKEIMDINSTSPFFSKTVTSADICDTRTIRFYSEAGAGYRTTTVEIQ